MRLEKRRRKDCNKVSFAEGMKFRTTISVHNHDLVISYLDSVWNKIVRSSNSQQNTNHFKTLVYQRCSNNGFDFNQSHHVETNQSSSMIDEFDNAEFDFETVFGALSAIIDAVLNRSQTNSNQKSAQLT